MALISIYGFIPYFCFAASEDKLTS